MSVSCSLMTHVGKELTSWLFFSCVLSLSNTVSWVRYGTGLYRFLIFAFILTFSTMTYVSAMIRDKDVLIHLTGLILVLGNPS